MTPERLVTVAYLAVSVESLLVQAAALHRLRTQHAGGGLIRTVACRVGCSVLYVLVGVNALLAHGWAVLQVTFAAYLVTQLTWQINSRMDVRRGRPRKPRRGRRLIRVTVTVVRAPLDKPTETGAP